MKMAAAGVRLDDILEALETLSSDFTSYVKKSTGAVVSIGEEYFRYAEDEGDEDEHPDWMMEIVSDARDILRHPESYLELPSSWDIHEYKIIEAFCRDIEDLEKQKRLLNAIRGRGAFRRFKDKAEELGVLDEWYQYRTRALTDIAIKWCEENHVEVIRDDA